MSSAGKKLSHSFTRQCLVLQATPLIRLIENYPIVYIRPPRSKLTHIDSVNINMAWQEIASKIKQSQRSCKSLWAKIKMRYAKIMILVKTGKIEKEAAMSHPETRIYFDGLLSFLDPHLINIKDVHIPYHVHKFVNDLFGIETKQKGPHKKDMPQCITHGQVKASLAMRRLRGDSIGIDTDKIQAIMDIAVKRKLSELCSEIVYESDENNEIMVPSKNTLNQDDNNSTRSIQLGLESELIIENDVKREEDMTEDEIKTEKNVEMEDHLVREDQIDVEDHIKTEDDITIEEEVYLKEENFLYVHNVPASNDSNTNIEENSEDMTDNAAPVTDEYIRNFFSELGVVMSMELSNDKQKILMSRINELLKTIVSERGSDELYASNATIIREEASRAEN